MLAILKIVAIVGTALFGLFGAVWPFRNPQGKPTRTGIAGIIGIVFCAVLAAVLQLYDDADQDRKVLSLLSEIDRTLHPLQNLKVSYRIEPDWSSSPAREFFLGYHDALIEGISPGHPDVRLPKAVDGIPLNSPTQFGSETFSLSKKANDFEQALCGTSAVLLFYRTPIDVSTFEYRVEGAKENLRIDVRNPCFVSSIFNEKRPKDMMWNYDLRDSRLVRLDLEIEDQSINSASDDWKSDTSIASLQDLLGTELIIYVDTPSYPVRYIGKPTQIQQFNKLTQTLALRELVVRLGDGTVLAFDHDNWRPFFTRDHHRAYAMALPSNMQELLKVTRYDQFKDLKE